MIPTLLLLALSSGPDLTSVRDQLFHHSDLQLAAASIDQILQRFPDDPDALDLGVIAHAALGDSHRVVELAVKRADRGDEQALPVLLFGWQQAQVAPADAEKLRAVTRKLLPKLKATQAAPLRVELAQLDRLLGHFDEAVADAKLPGQIVDWQIVGPFENDQGSGFDNVFAPEHGVKLSDTYPGKIGSVQWRPLLTRNWNGTLCLSCAVSPSEGAVAYLVTWVNVRHDTEAALWASTEGKLKVWVDGRLAATDRNDRRAEEGQSRAGVRLTKGWNQILMKAARRGAGWTAGLRVTDLDGKPLDGLTVAPEAHDFSRATETVKWPKPPEDSIVELLPTEKAPLPAGYLKAWRLDELGHAREARLAFELLVSKGPRCAICLYGLAHTTLTDEDPDRALTALSEAQDDDPNFARAALFRARIHDHLGLRFEAEQDAANAVARNAQDDDALGFLSELRLRRGFVAEASRLATAADQAFPGWMPHLLDRAEATLALGDHASAEALFRQALAADPASSRAVDALAHFLTSQGRPAEAATLYTTLLAQNPGHTGVLAEIAEADLQAKDEAGVTAQVAEIRRLSPDSSLADRLRGELLERRGDREGALAAYQKALALQPSDGWLRDHLEVLAQAAEPVTQFQMSAAELRRRAITTLHSSYPGANAVVLLKEATTVLHEDGSERYRLHYAVKVFDDTGIQRYLNFNVGHHHNLKIERAGTLDEAGDFHEVSSIDDEVVHFPVPGYNSTFEIIFTADSPPRAGTSWWDLLAFQGDDLALSERWILQHPTDRPLKTWKRGAAVDERHQSVPGGEVILFEAKNEPALVEEPDTAPSLSYRDLAMASTFQSWDEVVTWIRASVDDQLAEDVKDPKVQEIAKGIVARAKTLDEKVSALAAFVRRDIHYNQADTDIYKWRAHPARRVLETHYGDCKDKATLFLALAKNVGVVAEDAVLLVNFLGTTPTEIPTLLFDHAVAYLPPQPGLTHPGLLDLTASELGTDSVPFGDQMANALVFTPGGSGYRFEHIPVSPPKDLKVDYTLALDLKADGLSTGTITARAHGLAAALFRWNYRNARRQDAFLDLTLNGAALAGSTRVGKPKATGIEEPERDVELTVKVQAANLLRQVDNQKILRISGLPELEGLTRETKRTEPLRLGAPREWDTHRAITLPKELTAGTLPAPIHIDDPYFVFDLTTKQVDAHTVSIDTQFQMKVAEVAPDQFDAFRRSALAVQQAADVSLVLQPQG